MKEFFILALGMRGSGPLVWADCLQFAQHDASERCEKRDPIG